MRTKLANIAKTLNFGYILVNKDANRVDTGSVSCLLLLKMRAHGLDRMRTKAPPQDRATTLQISFKANCKSSHTHARTHRTRETSFHGVPPVYEMPAGMLVLCYVGRVRRCD